MNSLPLKRAVFLLILFLLACNDASVESRPDSSFSLSFLDFGSSSSASTELTNRGTALSSWTVVDFVADANNPDALPANFTLSVSPFSGGLAPDSSQVITFSIDRTQLNQLESGTYQLELRFTIDGLQKSLALSFSLTNTVPDTPPDTPGAYDIQFEFSGSAFTASRRAIFETAASIWEEVIVGDATDVTIPGIISSIPADACGFKHPAYTGTIDDLLIIANVAAIDGPNNVLASAGPISPGRGADGRGLPFAGCMQFDSADIAILESQGALQNTIVHEMGHVLGIGTRWASFSTGECAGGGAGRPTFIGANAVAEWTTLNGGAASGNVPIEDDGGPGTRCGHWDEETFFTELMTGFLNTAADPLSRLTIASLTDLGYETDLTKAEPYSLPACSPNCSGLKLAAQAGWEQVGIIELLEASGD